MRIDPERKSGDRHDNSTLRSNRNGSYCDDAEDQRGDRTGGMRQTSKKKDAGFRVKVAIDKRGAT